MNPEHPSRTDAQDEAEGHAGERLFGLVYEELRSLAMRLLQGPGGTLQATALVHEAWMKLSRHAEGDGPWESRSHFLAVASKAMRQILVDHARGRSAKKRGGGAQRVTLDDCLDAVESDTGDVLALSEALRLLTELHPRQAQIVEMRFFGGATLEEVAEALSVGLSTVKADWRFARAWLRQELKGDTLK
ncbi:MAG: sigma-70 family RNA polymerase sigma factor [Planctomycetes bacterium]|nr:sigma-70 family RNA polymerase sigma factor [Planctomycetota bacterium]